MKCPFCGSEISPSPIKEWRFRFYNVRSYICPNCNGKFNYYEGTTPTGKHVSFTIRVYPRAKKQCT